jgi:hypothetical protein
MTGPIPTPTNTRAWAWVANDKTTASIAAKKTKRRCRIVNLQLLPGVRSIPAFGDW